MQNKMKPIYFKSQVLCLLLMIFMAGCAGSRQSNFYMLKPASHAAADATEQMTKDSLAIGIGPVKIPQYLDRPQLITMDKKNRLHVAEYSYWAGPLKDQVPRVIMENLSTLLNTDRVSIFPWRTTAPMDFQITVDLIRMDPTPDGNIDFKARWSVLTDKGTKTLVMKKTQILMPAPADNYNQIANASGKALAQLCAEIALELKNQSN